MLCPGSSVVIVASLLEGAALVCGASEGQDRGGILRRAQRLRIITVFVDPALSTLFSFFLPLLFLLGFDVLFAPAVVSILYRCLLYQYRGANFEDYISCSKKKEVADVLLLLMD
jgi:hypothetical protein